MPARNVVLVAPLLRENTRKYVRAFADLDGVRFGIISQDPIDQLDAELRARVAGHWQLRDCMDGKEIAEGTRALAARLGPIDCLTGMLEQLQVPVAEAREQAGVPGLGLEAAQNFRDKDRMKAVLRAHGLPCARSRRIEAPADAWELCEEVGFPIVMKPLAGLGAKATWTIRDEDGLRDALGQLSPSPDHPWQAEEFIEGEERTCETILIGGRPVWFSGTRYYPRPLEVLEHPWKQYTVLLPREDDDAQRAFHDVNVAALRALGLVTGIAHMEWFLREDGRAVVSEVGARPPGAMIMPLMSLANEVDMVAKWARLVAHEEFDPPDRKYAAGCAFFRGQGPGTRVASVTGLDRAQAEVGALVVDRKLPEVGQPRSSSYEGEGWAIVRHEETRPVVHALLRMVSLVRVTMG